MFELMPLRSKGCYRAKGRNIFDNMLDSFFNDDLSIIGNVTLKQQPFNVDVQEIDNSYVIKADMPGVNKEDINITYDNNYLTISAKRDEVIEEERYNFVRRERSFGELARSSYIDDADVEKITASFENGVLTVNLPKIESKLNKKVDIN